MNSLTFVGDETLLKLAVASIGPIAIAVDASLSSFQNYKTGVYDDPDCSSTLNHGMLLTGYRIWRLLAHQKFIWHIVG